MYVKIRFLPISVMVVLTTSVGAQTIERMKLTDNDLNCGQIYAETQQMDSAMQLAGPGASMTVSAAASAQPAAVATGSACPTVPGVPGCVSAAGAVAASQSAALLNQGRSQQLAMMAGNQAAPLQGAVLADPNVQASIARARASGMSEAQINATVGLGMQRGGLGALAAPVAAPQATGLGGMLGALAGLGAQKVAPPAAAAPVAQPTAPAANSLSAQARARKDYLTGLFLSRGCRLSEVQK